MFSRDKESLQDSGLLIEADTDGTTRLIASDSFCDTQDFNAAERATLALAGFAQLGEPLFPLPFALRLALTKLSGLFDKDCAPALRRLPASSALGRHDPESSSAVSKTSDGQATTLLPETLLHAISTHHILHIRYTNRRGVSSHRGLAPYGLFLLAGRWYIVGHDEHSGQVRTFKLTRITEAEITDESFMPPEDFSCKEWVVLPFEIGETECVQTVITIPAQRAPQAATLTRGRGSLTPREDGGLDWQIGYRDLDALTTFVLGEGLGFGRERERSHARHALETMVGGA